MKTFQKYLANQLRNHSLSLAKKNLLTEKPWTLIDDEFEIQKLIFKKSNDLIISKNGNVVMGKWEYFPEAKSLLIDRNTDKILCNEVYIDEGVLILKMDGTDNRFFTLANETVIPDLDIDSYLKKIRYKKLSISTENLTDGRVLEIARKEKRRTYPAVGDSVTINAEPAKDGLYNINSKNRYYEVKKAVVNKILIKTTFTNPDGNEIIIKQQDRMEIRKGDYIFMSGQQLENATIKFNVFENIVVRNGQVERVEWRNIVLRRISRFLESS